MASRSASSIAMLARQATRPIAVQSSAAAVRAVAARGFRSAAVLRRPGEFGQLHRNRGTITRVHHADCCGLTIAEAPLGSPSIPPFSEPVGKNPAELSAGLSTPLHEYGQYILTCLPKYIQQFSVYKDELTLYTAPTGVIPVLTFLRDHHQCQYKSIMDITAVDYPTKSQRFEVSTHPPAMALVTTPP